PPARPSRMGKPRFPSPCRDTPTTDSASVHLDPRTLRTSIPRVPMSTSTSAPTDATDAFAERFGPHPSRSTAARLDPGAVPDRAVHTHCCFCGQQCGITLLVKDEEVIGFEPWMEFPFNQGKLCPKGVKRYLQGAHSDRLTTAVAADPSAPGGFRAVG